MKKIITICACLSLLGFGCTKIQNQEPLSYTVDQNSTLTIQTLPFDFTPEQLQANAQECGNNSSLDYFNKLVSEFKNTDKIVYNFKYNKTSQDEDIYIVTLLPNKPGYETLAEFKRNFDLCFAGGEYYPMMLNKNWLVFGNSCGTGFDDGSDLPHGCQEVKNAIEPSLKLN